jgi:hypothetical protein
MLTSSNLVIWELPKYAFGLHATLPQLDRHLSRKLGRSIAIPPRPTNPAWLDHFGPHFLPEYRVGSLRFRALAISIVKLSFVSVMPEGIPIWKVLSVSRVNSFLKNLSFRPFNW